MLSALGDLIPIAVAAALSTVPITVMVLILLSPERKRSAIPFLIGWVLGMLALLVIGAFGASFLPLSSRRTPQVAFGVAEIVVGSAILLVAILAWRRARRSPSGGSHRWLQTASSLGPRAAFGTAFALNLRPKGLLLSAAAGLAVVGNTLPVGQTVSLVVIYLGLGTSTVVAPIITTLANPTRMQPRLEAAQAWLLANASAVASVVMILIGVVIVGSGLSRL